MTVKAVCFDLDDTLLWDARSVQEAFQAVCGEAAKQYPAIIPEKLEHAVRSQAGELYQSFDTFPFTKMIGINPIEALWARFDGRDGDAFLRLMELAPDYRVESWTRGLQELGIQDIMLGRTLAELFPQERRARPIVYKETFSVLNEMQGNFQLLLLTNGAPDLQREKIDGVPGLASYFDHIVISGVYGEGKPRASIFHHALGLLGVEPAEAIMIGDKLTTDILGANGVGMKSFWVNREGSVRTDDIVPSYEITNLHEVLPLIRQIDYGN